MVWIGLKAAATIAPTKLTYLTIKLPHFLLYNCIIKRVCKRQRSLRRLISKTGCLIVVGTFRHAVEGGVRKGWNPNHVIPPIN